MEILTLLLAGSIRDARIGAMYGLGRRVVAKSGNHGPGRRTKFEEVPLARVTTEDCIDKEPNRFDLVMLAACRARELSSGYPPTVDRDNDKDTVIALREIAEETQLVDQLRERTIRSHQKQGDASLQDDLIHARLVAMDSGNRMGITSSIDVPDDDMTEDQMLKMMERSDSD